jgi:hypothetical protein
MKPTHALLWSQRANAVRVVSVKTMLAENMAAYRENRTHDCIVTLVGPREQCDRTARNLRGTLDSRQAASHAPLRDREAA